MAENTQVQVFYKRNSGVTNSIKVDVCFNEEIAPITTITRAILSECQKTVNNIDCDININVTRIINCQNNEDIAYLANSVNNMLKYYMSPPNLQIKTDFLSEKTTEYKCTETCNPSGGKIPKNASKYEKTNKKVKIGNAMRCIYVGSRGGEYVMQNKAYIPLKKALVSTASASASAKVSVSKKK
jgi:hypothetical protein